MSVQHDEAVRLLPIIVTAAASHQLLTYQTAAEKLGRPRNNARMVAQVCDLLDAAAALADVPLLALITVREASLHINRKAWASKNDEPWLRDAIISRSEKHTFMTADFEAIAFALEQLKGKSNISAWAYLRELMPSEERRLRLAGAGTPASSDAIEDLGTDSPAYLPFTGKRYARNPQVRAAVLKRASGHCELCGEPGFMCQDGTRYLECHHIIALANEGEDKMTNVIGICPKDHREAHYGIRRGEIEAEMIAKVQIAEAKRKAEA